MPPESPAREIQLLREALAARIAFQTLVGDLSSTFAELPRDAIDAGIDHALAALGRFACVDRAYIFRFASDGTSMSNTHEWCAEGIAPTIDMLQDMPLTVFPWWAARLRQREIIHVTRVSELPDEASTERAILTDQNIRSVLAMPMLHERAVVGFLGFDAVRAEKTWDQNDIALLRIVGEMFVAAIERKRMLEIEDELIHARSLENVARLAGGVAHDFNNILAVIINCAAILRRKNVDPQQSALIDDIYESGRRAADLTRQLLQVGHRGVTEPVVLDLGAVLANLMPLLTRTLGEQIRIELQPSPVMTCVRIGLPQLEQVMLNLAVNARDAMPRGGTLVMRAENVTIDAVHAARFIDVQPGDFVRFTVSDTGVGMAPAVASRAFEPFFTTKGKLGTGLGLSTVHGIVKQAGGHVALETTPGVGTTLRVYLPAALGVTPTSLVRPTSAAPLQRGRGETVLVVEDSSILRSLVRTVLVDEGYRVLDAETPHEALAIADERDGAIDLLLTDVILPEMSGRDLAARMGEAHALRRVVYMSGYDDDVVAKQGIIEAGTHFLQKPFLEGELLRLVRRVLDEALPAA